jgi:hypothetical protein
MSTVSSTASYAVWGVILAGGLALWGVARTRGSVARPADAVGGLAVHPVFRVMLVLVFMWFGWHLFAR